MPITTLRIDGMHCSSCKMLMEMACTEEPGVQTCMVDIEKGTGVVHHDDRLDVPALVKKLEGLGAYHVQQI